MSNLVDRIAAVLREHHFRPVEDHWQCTAQGCTGKWLSSSSESAHVAERIAEALTEQWPDLDSEWGKGFRSGVIEGLCRAQRVIGERIPDISTWGLP